MFYLRILFNYFLPIYNFSITIGMLYIMKLDITVKFHLYLLNNYLI